MRLHGLGHLARCERFFVGLSAELITDLAYCASWWRWDVIPSAPAFPPPFMSSALGKGRFDAIGQLVEALGEVARRHYVDSSLIRIEEQPDGTKTMVITPPATETAPLQRALLATELAVSVADQVLAQRGTDSATAAIVEKLDGMGYMAGGLSIAGWAYGLSGYFEDQSYALHSMISNLKKGVRA